MNPFKPRKAKKVIIEPSPDESICYNSLCRRPVGRHYKIVTIRHVKAPICLRCHNLMFKLGEFHYNGTKILMKQVKKR